MQLIAEGFSKNTKVSVEGNDSYWIDGETVRINGVDKTVSVDGSQAILTDVATADTYRALYPDTLNSSATLLGDNTTVFIPHTYNYREHNGRQQLGSPMAAYGTSDRRLEFKHLTAAVTVEVKNIYGFTIEVDSIVVSSNDYQLCGSRDITLGESLAVAAVSGAAAADRRVKMCFTDTPLQILSGETRRVQVPVLPVGNDNRFSITVGVHKVYDADVKCEYTRTQGDTQDSYALGRAEMGYAGLTFGKAFSISSTKQVIISQGNLQYVPATGVWSFHTHQYDICETGGSGYTTTRYFAAGTDPIDLFGFGTSGYNNMYPYMTSITSTDYLAPASSLSGTSYDWGYYNAISNGGNMAGLWYTPEKKLWDYLLLDRTPTTVGINNNAPALFTFTTIGGVHKGLIVFPDDYTHPTDASTDLSDATFNSNSNYTAAVPYSDWAKMEAAGAVFFPAAGYRNLNGGAMTYITAPNQGKYWTASSSSTTRARNYYFYSTSAPANKEDDRNFGLSVRVVKDL